MAILSEDPTREALDVMASLLASSQQCGGWKRGGNNGNERSGTILLRDVAARQIAGLAGRTDLFAEIYQPRDKLDTQIRALEKWWADNRKRSIDDIQREAIDLTLESEDGNYQQLEIARRITGRKLRRGKRGEDFKKAWARIRSGLREEWIVSALAERGVEVARPWEMKDVELLVGLLEQGGKMQRDLGPAADWLLRHMFGSGPMFFESPHAYLDGYIRHGPWQHTAKNCGPKWRRFINSPDCPSLDKGTEPKPAERF